jgi:hypothetical protein
MKIQEGSEKQETTASYSVLILEPQTKAHCKGVKTVSTEGEFSDVTGKKFSEHSSLLFSLLY